MFLSNSFVVQIDKLLVDVNEYIHVRAFPSAALVRSTTEQLVHELDSVLRCLERNWFEIITHSWKRTSRI